MMTLENAGDALAHAAEVLDEMVSALEEHGIGVEARTRIDAALEALVAEVEAAVDEVERRPRLVVLLGGRR